MEPKLPSIIDEKLQLWDSLGDDVEVFLPTVWNKNRDSRAMFVELVDPKDRDRIAATIFLNREDAGKYRQKIGKEEMAFVKITLGRLYNSFAKYFSKTNGKKFECVLSTVDIRGDFRQIEIIWSNQNHS